MTAAATLTATAEDIVNGALRLIGEIDANQPTPAPQMQDGLQSLDYMVKHWQSQGLHLWTKKEGILFLDAGKTDYKLGPNGDECGNLDDFENTELSIAGVTNDRIINVDSTSGILGADDILASDPSESTQGWTAVGGTLAIAATSLVVSNAAAVAGEAERTITGLTVGRQYRFIAGFTLGSSVSATYSIKDTSSTLGTETLTATGTSKFNFTATQTSLTLEILNGDTAGTNTTTTTSIQILDATTGDFVGVRLDDGTRQWSKAVEILSTTQIYIADAVTGAAAIDNSVFSFPELVPRPVRVLQMRRVKIGDTSEIEVNKWSRTDYFAQPDKTSQGTVNNWYYSPQLTDGRLYVWQTANDADQVLKFTYERPLNTAPETSDVPDFPSEWFMTLKYQLAAEIGPEYKIPQDRLSFLTAKAAQLLEESIGFDVENSSMDMQPDFRY